MSTLKEQLEIVARNRDWHQLLAKSNPSQTLLSHARAVRGVASALAEASDLAKELREVLMLGAFLHDLGKETEEFQRGIKRGKAPPHLPTREGIEEFLKACSINDEAITAKVFVIASATHEGAGEAISKLRAVNEFVAEGETSSILELGEMARLADWIASAPSPRDAMRATKNESFLPLIESKNLKFTYYSLLKVRGILSYLLHKAMQKTYKSLGYKIVAVYPEGCLLVGNKPLDETKFVKRAVAQTEELLKKALLDQAFLESATALQINRAMVANEELVAIDSLPVFADYAAERIQSLPGKTDEQKKAIFLRFISTLQNAIRAKTENIAIDDATRQQLHKTMSTLESEIMGIDFGALGLPMSYDVWNDLLKEASKVLEEKGYASRDVSTMPLDRAFASIKKGYLALIKEMEPLFNGDEFHTVRTLTVDTYLEELLGDVGYPLLTTKGGGNQSAGPSAYHATANRFLKTYREAKKRAMGPTTKEVRCPICGSAATGTKAIAAGVGPGTKKFINEGIGTVRLDNINVCSLCLLEGILRGAIGYGYVLMPQVALSYEEAEVLAEMATYLRRLDRNPEPAVKMFLEGTILDFSQKLKDKMEHMCREGEWEPFRISKNVVGNYILMTTSPDKRGLSNSEGLAIILIQAIALSLMLEVRVRIFEGLDMVDVTERDGAVIFPANGSLLRTLGLRESVIGFDQAEEIGLKLALAKRAKFYANLSDRNGIQQALNTHPGQLAQRILLKRDYPTLSEIELMILTRLQEVDMMGTLVDDISDILDKYYRPEKYGTSMHSILGPMNALYTQFRKTASLDEETVQAIAGRVHRQLQQLSRGDYMATEAAAPILDVCTQLAEKLSKEGTRDRKKILDDLRYAVYLRRLISINERIQRKKAKDGGN
ncbi:MAG: hypothetical protein ACTSYL_10830 [Candidatus Thorarchaeota archaeon]